MKYICVSMLFFVSCYPAKKYPPKEVWHRIFAKPFIDSSRRVASHDSIINHKPYWRYPGF